MAKSVLGPGRPRARAKVPTKDYVLTADAVVANVVHMTYGKYSQLKQRNPEWCNYFDEFVQESWTSGKHGQKLANAAVQFIEVHPL